MRRIQTATSTACICDRCGKKIKFGVLPRKRLKIHSTIITGFGAYDFWEYDYNLCKECTKDFQKFMENKEQEK